MNSKKVKISLKEFSVEEVEDFRWLPGCYHNGQHYQMSGYVLAEIQWNGPSVILQVNLFHPDTVPQYTGHIDLIAQPFSGSLRKWTIRQYKGMEKVYLEDFNSWSYLFPTGRESLLRTLEAIKNHLTIAFFERRFNPGLVFVVL